jgi:hypothetical protein
VSEIGFQSQEKKSELVLELLQANQAASSTIPAFAQLHTEIMNASSQ